MKNTSSIRRILSVALVIAMLASFLVPVASAEPAKRTEKQVEELNLTPMDPGELEPHKLGQLKNGGSTQRDDHALTDIVRVSIVLEKPSTLEAGFSTENIAANPLAVVYRNILRAEQKAVTSRIEKAIAGKLDVKWNLTLAANNISANVTYGSISRIKAVEGVKDVFLEIRYEPQKDEEADGPNNGVAASMIGSDVVWTAGLTGAGSRLAVIDTGTDTAHQSFSGEGLEYALRQTAEEKGMTYEAYVETLDLLTAEKIDAVKDQLNVSVTGEKAYVNTKLPFGYSYIDAGYEITHENDTQGEHGSHVAGISTANRFIKVGDEFQPAMDTVCTQGVAPDAQLITMKVFGKKGGAYESDYMSAIEDAIVLGCDSANLSLGSSAPGFGFSSGYEKVLNKLVENGMVCAISMGNSGMWYDTAKNKKMINGYIYADDVTFNTGGSPGSFVNSLTVASSDNVGKTGKPLIFGDKHVFYNETSYKNQPMTTLVGSEYDYVLIDGPGVDDNAHVGQEGDQFLALGSEVLTGKIAMCYRGTSSFFAKANAAVAQGAVGVVIINNQPGTINMALDDYNGPAPVVSIMKVDGDAVKESSEPVTNDNGDVLYYTGKVSVGEGMEISKPDEITDTIQVSSFSSYGVPGTLVMKPEILAPGGSIYSVFGYNKLENGNFAGGHDQYELMSGTSMAAPQINGLAGIMAQYIRENDLCSKTGLSQRQLINSLLMSTAHPVYDEDGAYWATLRVGAGHANVADAVSAKSYIMMDEGATLFPDSAKDGKIKAELGDDPERTGKYDFAFTLTPMEKEKKEFTLRTDIFTQAIAGDGGYGLLQDTATMLIGAETTYEIDGKTYKNSYPEADVNMDGETNAADAQAILDHLTGEEAEGAKFDADAADVDGDGEITTYDAKLLLDSAESPVIEVSEATKITVHIQLNPSTMKRLGEDFPKGFFVEGYTYVEPVADEEGKLDVVHSIPILGYYGSWTEPSMFDRTSAIDEAYGTGKLPYVENTNTNYLVLKDAEGNPAIYMGNPYIVEKAFPADRLAMRSDATVESYNYLNIRNVVTLGFAVQDQEGKVLYSQVNTGNRNSAYYHVNQGSWQNTTPSNYKVGKQLSAVNGVKEGEQITVGFYALPEYIAVALAKLDGKVATAGGVEDADFKKALEESLIGDGAAIKYDVTIDDTAPVIAGAVRDLITGEIKVKASDDRYIAYVGVLNKAGTTAYAGKAPEQSEMGEEVEVSLNLEGQRLPEEVVILVGDYAGNEAAVRVALGGGESNLAGLTFAFTSASGLPGAGNRMLEIDKDALTYNYKTNAYTGLSVAARTSFAVEAAEYVEGHVFMAGDDGNFHVMKLNDTEEISLVGAFSNVTASVYDMAYNYQDKQLYVLGEGNKLYTMDLYSGELTKAAEITITNPKSGANLTLKDLAIDGEGNFYSANILNVNELLSQVYLYKFDLGMVDGEGKIVDLAPVNNTAGGGLGAYNMTFGGSMAWDHNTDKLYVISNYMQGKSQKKHNANVDGWNGLFVVDVATGKATPVNEAGEKVDDQFNSSAILGNACSGLIIVPGSTEMIKPSDTAKNLTVDPASVIMLKGQTSELKETVSPWTLTDKSVTWKSNDESIATVQEGKVTAVAVGTTTVTVTTNAEPHLTFDVNIEVIEAPEVELRGIIWNESGEGLASVFKTSAPNAWEGIETVGQLRWGALVDDMVYGSTDSKIFGYDADTYELKEFDAISKMWVPSDAAALPKDLGEATGLSGRVVGICNNGLYFEVLNPEAGKLNYWNLTQKFNDDHMATIAYGGRDGQSAVYYVMTESGELYKLILDVKGEIDVKTVGSTGISLAGVSDVSSGAYASMHYSEEKDFFYITFCNGTDDLAHLYAVNAKDLSCNSEIGNFNEAVWPVAGLHTYTPATDLVLNVEPTEILVYETETEPVIIKIKLGETNEYTAEVADPSICSFENGVVTGLKAGTTTITITTKDTNDDGQKLSKAIQVTVKEYKKVDVSVHAQVADAQGLRFTEISLNGAVASNEGVAVENSLISGGRSANLYLGAEVTGEGEKAKTVAHILDAETFQPTDVWPTNPQQYVHESYFDLFPPTDVAKMPRLVTPNGTLLLDEKFIFTSTLGWLVRPNFYGWDLKQLGLKPEELAGICLWYVTPSTTEIAADLNYLVLTTTGQLFMVQLKPATGELLGAPLFETGITFDDQMDCSMAVVNNPEKGISGVAVANNGDQKLYFIDFSASTPEDAVGYVGKLNASHISGLYGALDADANDIVVGPDDTPQPPQPPVTDNLSFDFNSDPEAAGWTMVDADGDGENWFYVENKGTNESGCMKSASWDGDAGKGMYPDNYLVSPALDLSGMTKPVASFQVKVGMDDYADKFQILAGTTANVTEMTVVGEQITGTEAWTEYTLDLSELAGQSAVYVAIRHYDSGYHESIYVDDFAVNETASSGSIEKPVLGAAFRQLGDGAWNLSVPACPEGIPMTKYGESVNKSEGGTNAVIDLCRGLGSASRKIGCENPVIGDGKVSIALNEDEESTNGLHVLTYEADKLTYVDSDSKLPYISIHNEVKEKVGTITVAYASAEKLPVDALIATLNFTYKDEVKTEIKIETVERNDDVAIEEDPVIIPIDSTAHVHAYGEPEWKWNEDLTKATATFTCECGDAQTLEAEISVEETPAAPHIPGAKKTIAKVTFDGKEYTDEKSEEIPALPCPCAQFKDMPEYGTVEHTAIDWAYTHEPQITNGVYNDEFRPEATVKRGEAMTFLWRAKEKPAPADTKNPFTDVTEGRYYYEPVLWAVNTQPQIAKGMTETSFAPEKVCNHAEIVTFLWRAMGEPEPKGESPYTATEVPAGRFFYKAAIWAYENGIYKGVDGEFKPFEDCTRAEIVVFLYRYFTNQDLAE